jgi:hypothetical protein
MTLPSRSSFGLDALRPTDSRENFWQIYVACVERRRAAHREADHLSTSRGYFASAAMELDLRVTFFAA